MGISDFHCHTKYSYDSASEPEKLIKIAISRGVSTLAFTDHFDADHVDSGIGDHMDFAARKAELLSLKEQYKDKIEIIFGIEIGQPQIYPEYSAGVIKENGYEFVLGSVHNLEKVPDFYFLDFSKLNKSGMIDVLYSRYVDALIQLTEIPSVDCVGHITYPLRYIKEAGNDFEIIKYYDKYELFFKKLVASNKIIEINTSGIRKGLGFTMPDEDLLKIYKDCGGKYVTVGSDCHRSGDLACDYEEGAARAERLGLNIISTLNQLKSIRK